MDPEIKAMLVGMFITMVVYEIVRWGRIKLCRGIFYETILTCHPRGEVK
jgi:hypothetical protein